MGISMTHIILQCER